MQDIVFLNVLAAALFGLLPLSTIRRGMPKLLPGSGVRLPDLEAAAACYPRRYRERLMSIALGCILFVYVLIRVLLEMSRGLEGGSSYTLLVPRFVRDYADEPGYPVES